MGGDRPRHDSGSGTRSVGADFHRRFHEFSFVVWIVLEPTDDASDSQWLRGPHESTITPTPDSKVLSLFSRKQADSHAPQLPEAPVFVRERVFPFLYFISEPFLVPFRRIIPMQINGFDLAVFPAFAGVLFIIAVTDAVGADAMRSSWRTRAGPLSRVRGREGGWQGLHGDEDGSSAVAGALEQGGDSLACLHKAGTVGNAMQDRRHRRRSGPWAAEVAEVAEGEVGEVARPGRDGGDEVMGIEPPKHDIRGLARHSPKCSSESVWFVEDESAERGQRGDVDGGAGPVERFLSRRYSVVS